MQWKSMNNQKMRNEKDGRSLKSVYHISVVEFKLSTLFALTINYNLYRTTWQW